MKKEELIIEGTEITCPYCVMQFGGVGAYFNFNGKVNHVDIMFSSEAGQSVGCTQKDILKFMNGEKGLKEEYKLFFNGLSEKFKSDPSFFTKETTDFNGFVMGLMEVMNYGELEGEDEEYDRGSIKMDEVKSYFNEGMDLKTVMMKYIIKS